MLFKVIRFLGLIINYTFEIKKMDNNSNKYDDDEDDDDDDEEDYDDDDQKNSTIFLLRKIDIVGLHLSKWAKNSRMPNFA